MNNFQIMKIFKNFLRTTFCSFSQSQENIQIRFFLDKKVSKETKYRFRFLISHSRLLKNWVFSVNSLPPPSLLPDNSSSSHASRVERQLLKINFHGYPIDEADSPSIVNDGFYICTTTN